MKFTIQETITSNEIDTDTFNGYIDQIEDFIKDNTELVDEIKKAYPEEDLELKINEMAEDALSKVKIYVDFDVEVEVK